MNWKKLLRKAKYTPLDVLSRQENLSQNDLDLLQEILESRTIDDSIELLDSVDANQMWGTLHAKLGTPRTRQRRIIWIAASSVAAMLLLYIGINFYHEVKHPIPVSEFSFPETNHRRATLYLEDGTSLDLDTYVDPTHTASNKYFRIINGEILDYSNVEVDRQNPAFNRLVVPRGAEYRLYLSDGSKVHLNAESEIQYPVHFEKHNNREVRLLKGEAYFEIEQDVTKPFVVRARDLKIDVLGTAFNVNTYMNNQIVTTLVDGIVRATYGTNSLTMQPNEQLIIEEGDGEITIDKIDIETAAGWHFNRWTFEQLPLSEVMETLGRWYDFEIEFVDEEARNLLYTARLQKYSRIESVLNLIEKTDRVTFTARGNSIYVHMKTIHEERRSR